MTLQNENRKLNLARCSKCGEFHATDKGCNVRSGHIAPVVRLLPCPFCGGHANLIIEMGEHYIKCMMCYTTTGWKDNEESAIKAWNTRQ